jgi:hypothetical protein
MICSDRASSLAQLDNKEPTDTTSTAGELELGESAIAFFRAETIFSVTGEGGNIFPPGFTSALTMINTLDITQEVLRLRWFR